MEHEEQQTRPDMDYVSLSADIVSAYVSKNHTSANELPDLIGRVHESLKAVGEGKSTTAQERPEPIVPIKKTVSPEYIISLEDGKRYRSLKRHLSARGLSPDQYRAKWGLPQSYPMVASGYSQRRSELAKALGLGQARKGLGTAAKKASAKASKKGSKKVAA